MVDHLYAGPPCPSECTAVASWKGIERQLQDLPFAWFEASDEDNNENHMPNSSRVCDEPADICKTVVLLSPTAVNIDELRHFSGNPGKMAVWC